jgi:hypothetical protein
LPLQLRHVQYKRMGHRPSPHAPGRTDWTYLLEDGKCINSLSLETARAFGIGQDVIQRAEDLAATYDVVFGRFTDDADAPDAPEAVAAAFRDRQQGSRAAAAATAVTAVTAAASAGVAPAAPTLALRPAAPRGSAAAATYRLEDVVPLLAQRAGVDAADVTLVEHGFTPPPALEDRSVVYVLHLVRRGGQPDSFYVGECAGIRRRLQEHRSTRFADVPALRAAVVPVGRLARSQARQIETAVINDLHERGYDVESSGDKHNTLY